MKLKVAFALALVLPAAAQTLTPTLSSASIVAGKSVTLTVSFTAGSTPAAALEWSVALPAGATAVWTASSSDATVAKSLSCNPAGTICIVAGLNTTAIQSGAMASAVITFTAATRGSQTLTLASDLGSDASGNAIAITGGMIVAAVFSPFDLNQDGLVNQADFLLDLGQALGVTACGTGDFNGDGVCNVQDLMLLSADAASTNP